ncbi:amidohydrolase [Solimicrobium silvestre]|uniref:Putative metal-dependent hydrolase with the TIM-barrel fold n=1 Tax=Solimicrobium silvestre TaxID=2099400 RepID=A0A2S9GTX6_9BURK|nr:amidohydrolase [Solimicrobium silvestre]PRC91159.1 putative metal-dependent hydrolase with the TIM-barrel fold [Solimicrobium silvestre]
MTLKPIFSSLTIGTIAVAVLTLTGCANSPNTKQALQADTVYRNGYIYTVDASDSVQQALAVRDGRIMYVGSNDGAEKLIANTTKVIDLKGRMLMPGLIDAHMHPMDGGDGLRGCNLNYEALTITQFQARIQACLDADAGNEPDGWLEVTNWYRQAMLPKGADAVRATLDVLRTKRPIQVQSSDYHSVLANSRAIQLAGINAASKNPEGGSIARDAAGIPTGIFEDEASSLIAAVKPPHPASDAIISANLALGVLRTQGVTTFFDALADEPQLTAFAALQNSGKLTARAYFAPLITTDMASKPADAVAMLQDLAKRFDQGSVNVNPTISVHHAKLFMDGVVQTPAFTAALLKPYFVNQGSETHPNFVPGTLSGQIYLPSDVLNPMMVALAKAGFNPHIHAIGDRAVREALDAVAEMRKQVPDPSIRPGIAHVEVTDPADYSRFAQLNVTPVMSFQWAKPAPDMTDATKDFLGPVRFARMEPEGSLHAAGARIAFGSDWPCDPFNEWFALKVGVTRTNNPALWGKYPGRLNADVGLSRKEVLRAATMNSAYTLHLEKDAGSLEVGKLADLIILDRNFFSIDEEQIANIKVQATIVGGKVVYQADGF